MQDQTKLAMSSKDVTIQRDGSLITKPASPEKPKKSDNGIDESSPSSLFKSSFQVVDTNLEKAPSILSSLTGGKETTSAPDGDNEEEYDPAHPTDDVNDDTKEVVEDVYDPAHPTDDVSSEDDDPDTGKTDNDENEVETIEPESAPESSVNEFELVKVKDEPGVVNDEICQDSVVENVIEKSKDVVDELPTSINDEKSSIETVVKIEKNEDETVPETEEFIERDQLIERIEKNKEDKAKSKVNKESVEKFKLSGKFKPISSDNVESSGSTKLSVSDRFKMIEKSSKSPESANFDDEDPIHEMRKLDKELDLEFGNAEFAKKKDKNKEVRKNKRKVSLDESEGDGLRYKREVKEIHEKKKGDSSDYKYGYEEKEEGEVDEEYRLKDKKKKDKKKRKSEKHFENEEKDDSEIDRRIVIQVSQNTEDRTVWEEAERQRRKRDREEKRKDKLRDLDGKRDKKLKRLRSRSRSHERRRSRSKDRKRSRSHDRSRDKGRKKRRERSRSRSRSREWSHEKSRKKKKRDKKYSRDVEKDLGREWSRERSREREWSWENDWSSERGRDHHRSRGDSRDRGRDRKRSRDRSDDKVDMFGRSRSPFTRKSFVKDKHIVTQKPKVKPFRSDEVIEILDSSPPKKQKYDEVSSSESEKMSPERDQEEVQKISTIEVKNSGPRETNIIDNDEKDDDFDDEPEETEQFQYTDREEFTGQNKSKQMSQNLITLGVGNSEYDPANPTDTASPAAPPLPDSLHAPTPPLPPTGDFAQFPPPPPGPPPQGPPPGSVIIQDRASLRVPPGGPVSGPGILGEAPLLLQGPPPIEAGPPPSLMQQGPALSLPVNVLPPGFHRGLPPTIAPQRQVIVSPLRPAPPRVQGLPGANVTRFGWQVTTSSEGISSQFGTIIPSHARLPGPPIVNGPYDGLPPPSEPPLRPSAPGEPQLIHIGPDPRAPPPRLPIPLLPPSSDPLPISAMVSIPPPNSAMLSMPPPDISKCVSQSFNRPGTPPDSVSAILGLARMGANAVSGSTTLIPGLTAVSTMNVINGNHDKGSVNSNGEVRKMMGTSSKIEKSGENLQKSSNKQNSSGTLGSSDSKDVFKVPDIPATKGGKTDVETTEVIDMDMGSPIIEEGNIELPVSPQFDNLIDNPEDLLEEDFNKKMQKLIDKDTKKEASTGKDKNKDKSATPTKNKDIKDLKDSETKTDSPVKSKDDKSKRSKENKPQKSGHRSRRHHHKKHGEADKDLKQKALKDAHIDLDSQDLPSSAVDLTNKEKYLQKLHLQERVVEEVKMAIKPFYSSKKINKDQYKEILRKAVPKICHSKSGNINPMKIKSLVEAYVEKFTKRSKVSPKLDEQSPGVKANGERGKVKTVR
ncbi:PHD and RING finger domain-containing protein 1 [Mactra antiquata]